MGKKCHSEVMTSLKNKHEFLADLIGKNFHYVDMPVYGNFGDVLIYLGAKQFFSENGMTPKTVSGHFNFSEKWVVAGDTTVFHGWVYLGDLYGGPQDIRNFIIKKFPNNRIVILPQTIYFRSADEFNRCASRWSCHEDLHLCVRDFVSYEKGLSFTKNVYMLPDMAHQLWPLSGVKGQASGTLNFLRTDDEISNLRNGCGTAIPIDWPTIIGRRELLYRYVRKLFQVVNFITKSKSAAHVCNILWDAHISRLLLEVVSVFSSYENVVTDRLHGHILSCLLDKDNNVIDNVYGKNSTYVSAWTKDSRRVRLISSES
jgi:pyruvyl transferase EpsO